MAGTDDQNNDDGTNDDGKPDTGTDNGKPDADNDDHTEPKWKVMARKHETENAKLRKELDEIREATATDAEKAVDKARKEAREEALAEALSDRIDDALESAAATKLAKPGHVRLLDVDDRVAAFATADGKVDREAIGKALDKLVKDNPELGKDGSDPKPLKGGGKNGSASGSFSMNDAIREAAGR